MIGRCLYCGAEVDGSVCDWRCANALTEEREAKQAEKDAEVVRVPALPPPTEDA